MTVNLAGDGRWASVAVILALGVGCWPAGPARARLVAVLPGDSAPCGPRVQVGSPLPWSLAFGAVVALGAAVAGAGGAVAAGMVGALLLGMRRSRGHGRGAARELAALLDAIGVMAAELRAGAHPASAAAAAAVGNAAVHGVLASVSLGARLGAEVPALLRRHADAEPVIGAELGRVAAAWTLADRHGIALAELIEAVRADLEARIRLAGQVRAQLAGPKATAAVLAGLPILGVLLGQGIGADPWRVLTTTSAGQLLLVIGAMLACAGVLWSGRIMARAVPR